MTQQLPPPNLNGDYEGSCVGCLRGTDTGVSFAGPPEWVVAGLVTALGVEQDTAAAMVSDATGCTPGRVPEHEITLTFRACQECVSRKTSMKVGLIASREVPCYSPQSR